MPLIKREEACRVVPGREDNERCIGEPDVHLPVALDDVRCLFDIGGTEVGERIDACGHVAQDLELVIDTGSRRDQVIELRQDEWRHNQRFGIAAEQVRDSTTPAIACRVHGDQAAGIADDHSVPNPDARTSSTLSARSGSLKSTVPQCGDRRGRSIPASHCSSALRMIVASDSPDARDASASRSLSSSGKYTDVFTIHVGYPTYALYQECCEFSERG